ncbi:MAG: SDR family oxidoreductase [Phycisphaeraceae bacterium]|nr:SDR family oxidoreductase [Phycisphaeraceae bacterium]
MKGLFDLSQRVALVAGGGGYLGEPVCHALAAHGAHVIVADLNLDAARRVAQGADKFGSAEARQLDVGDEASIVQVIESIPTLDALVNMATFSFGKELDQITAEQWNTGLNVTLTGPFLLSRAAAERMPQRGGSIVHFASMYGLVSPDPRAYEGICSPNPPDYGAAKAALLQLTRYQAVFWAKRRIRVNAVAPGPFPNPQLQTDARFIDRLSQRVPLGRVGRAQEIAGAVVYLSSEAASFVTGTCLTVDGGWTAW